MTINYREEFEKIARLYIKREGIEDLLSSISKSDFYTAPASTRYHHSYEGGLVEHTLEVFNILYNDLLLNAEFTPESVVIVALFHDICKVGFYVKEPRNRKVYHDKGSKKDEVGRFDWESYMAYVVDDLLPLGHSEKSIIMVLEHMKLTIEEMMAIRWHMGLSVPKEEYSTMSKAFTEYPLALHLHIADMKSTYLE